MVPCLGPDEAQWFFDERPCRKKETWGCKFAPEAAVALAEGDTIKFFDREGAQCGLAKKGVVGREV